jgi:uncharacterized protein YbaP (TraB family)
MKKIFIFIALITLTLCLSAQTATNKTGSLLWKISGNGLSNPSYILGTWHIKSGDFFDSIPGAKEVFNNCEQVVGEIILSNMTEMQQQSHEAMIMSPDTTYKMLYSESEYKFVSEKISSILGGTFEQWSVLKPSALGTLVPMFTIMKYFPEFNPENVLDVRVQKEAQKTKKNVIALETSEEQAYLLYEMGSLKQQAEQLLCLLENFDFASLLIPKMIEAYNEGDLAFLAQEMEDEKCSSTTQNTAIIDDRNHKWMKLLPEIMRTKSSFIAVGAGHLPGENGLLNLLEKAGYTVEAVVKNNIIKKL